MLKYDTYGITYKELPNEVTLSFSITNCPHLCSGCHSPHLRKDIGETIYEAIEVIKKYEEHITAICFLGHGSEEYTSEFEFILDSLSIQFPKLKLGLYSGFDHMIEEFKPYLSYYKVGKYVEDLGGLDSPDTTNQIMYILKN